MVQPAQWQLCSALPNPPVQEQPGKGKGMAASWIQSVQISLKLSELSFASLHPPSMIGYLKNSPYCSSATGITCSSHTKAMQPNYWQIPGRFSSIPTSPFLVKELPLKRGWPAQEAPHEPSLLSHLLCST